MSGRVTKLIKTGRVKEVAGKFRCGVTGNQVRCVVAA